MKNNVWVIFFASLLAVLIGCQNAQGQQGENGQAVSKEEVKPASAIKKLKWRRQSVEDPEL